MVDWCCKHKDDMEIADHLPHHHLLLHFYRFGVHRVMPSKVIDVLFCWKRLCGRHNSSNVRCVTSHCVIWIFWMEHNSHTFEGVERFLVDLQAFFLCFPTSFVDFMDHLSLVVIVRKLLIWSFPFLIKQRIIFRIIIFFFIFIDLGCIG